MLLGKTSWRNMVVSCLARSGRGRTRRRAGGMASGRAAHSAMVEALECRVMLAAPVGSEHPVNEHTTSDQQTHENPRQAVATDASGNYVATWTSLSQDGDNYGVYARKFDANGNSLVDEFLVNTTTNDSQQFSSVAMNASGEFIIAWTSDAQDGQGYGVYAQRFAADGTPQGGEFLVNTETNGDQSQPVVAMNDAGQFVVIWTSQLQDGDQGGIYGQHFDENGDAIGTEFRVNTTTAADQRHPSVSMNNSGQFVVAWESLDAGTSYEIRAQRYDADGNAVGGEVAVNKTTAQEQQYPSVSLNDSGDFVVTWASNSQDGDAYGVFLQRFDWDADPLFGIDYQVNTTVQSHQLAPSVTLNNLGHSVVTWHSFGQDQIHGYGVYAREFNANGVALGNEFLVNTTVALDQIFPSISMNDAGHYVIIWTSSNQDGDGYGVFAQRFLYPNTAPTANAGGPYAGAEGANIVLDASGSSDPEQPTADLTFEWDLDYDGMNFNVDTTGIMPTVSFPDNFAARDIAVRVTDIRGESDIATTTVTVTNVDPVADAGTDQTVDEGDTVLLNGGVTDAGTDDTHTFLWQVSADNGQVIADGTEQNFSFVPNDNGTYTVTLTVTDDDGGMSSDETVITVENANPTVEITGVPAGGVEGTQITLGTTVTDAGSADTHTFAWEVTKNGAAFDSGAGSSFSFTPDDNGTYEVTVTATDDDGGTGVDTEVVTIGNADPAVEITGVPAGGDEGTQISLGTSVTDAGSADTHTFAWEVTKDGVPYTSGTGATFAFTPDDNGTYLVTVTATDDNGGTGVDAEIIVVDNVDPTVAITGAPVNSAEGTEITLGTTVTDPGSADTHTFAWEVTKNGAPFTSGTGATFAFTPDDDGTYEVTVTATDDDGGTGTDVTTIAVANADPSVQITDAPASADEGTLIALGTTVTDAGSADTHTFAWEVTKDGAPFDSGTGAAFAFTPDDDGTYEVTVTVTDDDGGQSQDTATIEIENVDPVAMIDGAPASVTEGTQVALTSSVTDAGQADTHTLAWSVTKDGAPYDTGTGAAFSFTPDDVGSFVVTLEVTDDDGGVGTAMVTIISEAIPAPEIVAPVESADALQPEFSWTSVAGVDHYDVWVNVFGSNQLVFRDQNVAGTTLNSPVELDNEQTYIWTVRGVTAGGVGGEWAMHAKFRVEVVAPLVAPPDLDPVGMSNLVPTFTWSDVAGADHYDVWVNVRGSNELVFRDTNVPTASFTAPTNLQSEQEYIWTVRAVDASGLPGPFAGHATFLAFPQGAPPAGAPTLTSPTDSTTDTTPTLEWTAVNGADHYDVWLNVRGTNELVFREENVVGESFTPTTPLDPGKEYIWTVRAISGDGVPGAWATHATFEVTVPAAPPGSVPTPIAPIGTSATNLPVFEWTETAGATRYDLWVNVFGSNELVFRNQNVVGSQFASSTELDPGQTYIWTVRAFVGDAASDWADHATFQVDSVAVMEPLQENEELTDSEDDAVDEVLAEWDSTLWWEDEAQVA